MTFSCAIEDAQRPGAKRCKEQCPSCRTTDYATLTLRTQEEQAIALLKTPVSERTQALLAFIDRAEELRKEINAFKLTLPDGGRSHCDKAADAMKGLVGQVRVMVGERVVADHLGVEPERKF